MTYMVIRRFMDERRSLEVVQTGLTLEEAQAHCRDPETSSSTATSEAAYRYTQEVGPWFDSFEEE